ncbi:aminotransferase class I/II-fold pyridoxal phosphate-dependent enzyme [Paenibacillus sp. NPDC056579]|uniref:aminotransferase class I/II-fold pyridoxal phosphate-dependent enzyme n=1 Tax=Paenibacillus sp. NPDC056579 TaxID=3345871 RepID=UPI0036D0FBD4
MGANIIAVPLGEQYTFDIDSIIEAVTERTKILCICSPNNPTGTYLSRAIVLVELGPNAKVIYEQLLNKGIIVRYGGAWSLPAMFEFQWEPSRRI